MMISPDTAVVCAKLCGSPPLRLAHIIDDDMLPIGEQRIRLMGFDAPEDHKVDG